MGLWGYVWYKLGYLQAQIDAAEKRMREITRNIERRINDVQKSLQECDRAFKEIK